MYKMATHTYIKANKYTDDDIGIFKNEGYCIADHSKNHFHFHFSLVILRATYNFEHDSLIRLGSTHSTKIKNSFSLFGVNRTPAMGFCRYFLLVKNTRYFEILKKKKKIFTVSPGGEGRCKIHKTESTRGRFNRRNPVLPRLADGLKLHSFL
jgi:hypothetical protein